jgi:hypothetical protein
MDRAAGRKECLFEKVRGVKRREGVEVKEKLGRKGRVTPVNNCKYVIFRGAASSASGRWFQVEPATAI